jgi:hypothetical protein
VGLINQAPTEENSKPYRRRIPSIEEESIQMNQAPTEEDVHKNQNPTKIPT